MDHLPWKDSDLSPARIWACFAKDRPAHPLLYPYTLPHNWNSAAFPLDSQAAVTPSEFAVSAAPTMHVLKVSSPASSNLSAPPAPATLSKPAARADHPRLTPVEKQPISTPFTPFDNLRALVSPSIPKAPATANRVVNSEFTEEEQKKYNNITKPLYKRLLRRLPDRRIAWNMAKFRFLTLLMTWIPFEYSHESIKINSMNGTIKMIKKFELSDKWIQEMRAGDDNFRNLKSSRNSAIRRWCWALSINTSSTSVRFHTSLVKTRLG